MTTSLLDTPKYLNANIDSYSEKTHDIVEEKSN